MERPGLSRDSVAMPYLLALLALPLAPALASAGDFDAAMRCVHGTMTSRSCRPTASAEQLANVALIRCADEIEMAAIALAGSPLVHARIDAARLAVRHELRGYALGVASGPVTDERTEPVAERTAAVVTATRSTRSTPLGRLNLRATRFGLVRPRGRSGSRAAT